MKRVTAETKSTKTISLMRVGVIFVLIQQLMAGTAPAAYKAISLDIPSAVVVFGRFLLAGLVLLGVVVLKQNLRKKLGQVTLKQLRGLILLGIIGSGLSPFLYLVAIRNIGGALSALIVSLEVPIGIGLAALLLKEKLTRKFVVVAFYVLVGFLLLVAKNGFEASWSSTWFLGVMAALFAALMWGLATVVGKVMVTQNLPPTVVTFFRYLVGASTSLVLLVVTKTNAGWEVVTSASAYDWLALGYLGVVVSGVGLVLYYSALKTLAAKDVSLLLTIAPVVATLLGVATGEVLSVRQWVGVVIVISGIGVLLKMKTGKGSSVVLINNLETGGRDGKS